MVKQKKSVEGGSNDERADWKDLKELEAFCRFCAVQVMEGQRNATGFLSKIGVNEVIRQLGEMGKVVTSLQIKKKWDHLRKRWKIYNKCLDKETGLGYDPGTGRFDTTDEWWNRKIAACPDAKTFKTKGLPNRDLMNIMFGGTVATGKKSFCTSGPIPTDTTEGSGDSDDNVEFIDPQCEPVVNVDAMEVEGPSSSRAGPAVNKGKGLATSVHIFKPISKKPKKKRSTAQEMSDSLKSISNVIVERSSLSACTPSAPTATAQVKAILDMVLSLPGVYLGHYLYMFSTIYFMEKEPGRHMFEALSDNKELQLKWLEKEYQRHPDYHFE
ncbi:L10-interacting MYB domain-containing protein-like isoform X2 [Quercus robur]|nr:L10-interacting MYB domain-containing protein-like isoform X2 [Quercus robur]XP_050241653.1 L10-interacting MYB domain-containing protein-like isoform X2 [Quercus robur]